MRNTSHAISAWIKGGLVAVTFILVFKAIAKKTNVPALTSIAGQV